MPKAQYIPNTLIGAIELKVKESNASDVVILLISPGINTALREDSKTWGPAAFELEKRLILLKK